MQDREPTYPGRVTLTPVYGLANTYDMERADQPLQEGTPLNKASLLKDATAALFGKTNAAVPDDILSLLSKSVLAKVSAKYTKHVVTYAEKAVGSTVTLNVGGKPCEFIVVQQGKPSSMYDDSCSGTWLLMKDIYENRQWHSSDVNKYETSAVDTWLNNDFVGLFDDSVQSIIKQVKIPYRQNGGSGTDRSGANGLSCKVFLLSGPEVGLADASYMPNDGAKLDYFNANTGADSKRIAYLNGSAAYWWLRSPYAGETKEVWFVNSNGTYGYFNASRSYGIRPCIIMPSDGEYVYYTDADGNVYSEQEVGLQLTDVLGNLISIPAGQIKDGVKIATGSYTGTGTSGASNPNSLTFAFEPKAIFMWAVNNGIRLPNELAATTYIAAIPANNAYYYGGFDYPGQSRGQIKRSIDGKTITWYSTDPGYQLNSSAFTYYYLAIG